MTDNINTYQFVNEEIAVVVASASEKEAWETLEKYVSFPADFVLDNVIPFEKDE